MRSKQKFLNLCFTSWRKGRGFASARLGFNSAEAEFVGLGSVADDGVRGGGNEALVGRICSRRRRTEEGGGRDGSEEERAKRGEEMGKTRRAVAEAARRATVATRRRQQVEIDRPWRWRREVSDLDSMAAAMDDGLMVTGEGKKKKKKQKRKGRRGKLQIGDCPCRWCGQECYSTVTRQTGNGDLPEQDWSILWGPPFISVIFIM